MSLINSFISWVMKKRMYQIGLFIKYPMEVQMEWFKKLINQAQGTEFGKQYGFADLKNYQAFADRVPVHDYEALKPYIDRMVAGEQNILWPTELRHHLK